MLQSGRRLSFGATRAAFVVVGPLFILIGIIWYWHSYQVTASALHADGQVVRVVEHPDNVHPNRQRFYPVFVYKDQQGIEHTIESDSGSNPPSHRVGDAVGVLYHAGGEEKAILYDWFTIWGAALFLSLLGLIFLAVGLAMYVWPQTIKQWEADSNQSKLKSDIQH